MKVIEEQRIVKNKIYIAEDGKEFATKIECEKYEKEEKERKEKELFDRKVKNFIYDKNGCCPLDYSCGFSDLSTYTWLKVENEKEYEELKKIMDDGNYELKKPTKYPYYYCIEDEYGNEFTGFTDYNWTIDDCINNAKSFFSNFGYDVEVKRKEI